MYCVTGIIVSQMEPFPMPEHQPHIYPLHKNQTRLVWNCGINIIDVLSRMDIVSQIMHKVDALAMESCSHLHIIMLLS